MLSPSEVLSAILEKPTYFDQAQSLVTDDVTYVCSTTTTPTCAALCRGAASEHAGPDSILATFFDVGRIGTLSPSNPRPWLVPANTLPCSGASPTGHAIMSTLVTTPFATFAKVKDSYCYFQFLGHPCDRRLVSRSKQWVFRSNPEGGEVTFGPRGAALLSVARSYRAGPTEMTAALMRRAR